MCSDALHGSGARKGLAQDDSVEDDSAEGILMRTGIFGGSFDPVHLGHLIAAEAAREQANLDRVLFVPAAVPPHKRNRQLARAADRLAMLELATGGHPAFAVSPVELDRGGVSYTVETLACLASDAANGQLVLLLGPDAVRGLPTWREPARIAELAELITVTRDGLDDAETLREDQPLVDLLGLEAVERLVAGRVHMPAVDIRATEIRLRMQAERSIRFLVPPAVFAYIHQHQLYRVEPPTEAASANDSSRASPQA